MREGTEGQRRPRRYDPDRRQRIAEAALRVAARDGLEGITHRAVAKLADVPVGSTTYHFADKDELLLAAVDLAAASGSAALDELFQACRPDEDLANAIVSWITLVVRDYRDQLTLHYELFLAARRNPALSARQKLVPEMYDLFRAHTDDALARTLVDVVEGSLARVVIFGKEFHADDLEARLSRMINS